MDNTEIKNNTEPSNKKTPGVKKKGQLFPN